MNTPTPTPRPEAPIGLAEARARAERAAEHETLRQLAAQVGRLHRERSYAALRYAG